MRQWRSASWPPGQGPPRPRSRCLPAPQPNVASVLFGATSPEQIVRERGSAAPPRGPRRNTRPVSGISAQPPELTLDRALGALYGLAIGDALDADAGAEPGRGAADPGPGARLPVRSSGEPISRGLPAGSVPTTPCILLIARLLVEGGGRIEPRRLATSCSAGKGRWRQTGRLSSSVPRPRRRSRRWRRAPTRTTVAAASPTARRCGSPGRHRAAA